MLLLPNKLDIGSLQPRHTKTVQHGGTLRDRPSGVVPAGPQVQEHAHRVVLPRNAGHVQRRAPEARGGFHQGEGVRGHGGHQLANGLVLWAVVDFCVGDWGWGKSGAS